MVFLSGVMPGVHCLTSLDTAHALISSLEHAFNNEDLTIIDIAKI